MLIVTIRLAIECESQCKVTNIERQISPETQRPPLTADSGVVVVEDTMKCQFMGTRRMSAGGHLDSDST